MCITEVFRPFEIEDEKRISESEDSGVNSSSGKNSPSSKKLFSPKKFSRSKNFFFPEFIILTKIRSFQLFLLFENSYKKPDGKKSNSVILIGLCGLTVEI